MAAKAFSISVSFLMLFQSLHITASDVLHIDKLWEHMDLHKREYGDGLFAFFSKHYGELMAQHGEQEDSKHGDHGNLPFKHNVQANALQVITAPPANQMLLTEFPAKLTESGFHYRSTYSFLQPADIFQPPRTL